MLSSNVQIIQDRHGRDRMVVGFKISQQPENWENRNGPDLVQVFLKKWWIESDFTAPQPYDMLDLAVCNQMLCKVTVF